MGGLVEDKNDNSRRIVFAIDTNTSGGAERVMANLANYFSEKGYSVDLINSDTSSDFYYIDSKVNVIKMGIDGTSFNKLSRACYKVKFLYKHFKSTQPDVVVAFLFNMESAAIIAGILSKVRVFTSVRNGANAYPKIERLFRRIFYPHIGGVVFQSSMVMSHPDFVRVKNKTVIMNPLSDRYCNPPDIVPYEKRRKWVINVGRLNEQKNQKLLIDSFIKATEVFQEYELHIFGTGPLKGELQKYAESRNGNGRIVFEGEMNEAVFHNRDALLFVLSSNFEGFPNALVEAMSVGIPVISTDFDSGVARELITDGVNGFLCNPNDVNEMAAKIKTALEMTEEKFMQMAKEASKVKEKVRAESIGEQWESFLFH